MGNGGSATVDCGNRHGGRYIVVGPIKLVCCGIIISRCIGEFVGGNINGGCAGSAWGKGCGVNRGAGGSKIRYNTTGYGDVFSGKIGGRCARSKR